MTDVSPIQDLFQLFLCILYSITAYYTPRLIIINHSLTQFHFLIDWQQRSCVFCYLIVGTLLSSCSVFLTFDEAFLFFVFCIERWTNRSTAFLFFSQLIFSHLVLEHTNKVCLYYNAFLITYIQLFSPLLQITNAMTMLIWSTIVTTFPFFFFLLFKKHIWRRTVSQSSNNTNLLGHLVDPVGGTVAEIRAFGVPVPSGENT